MFLSLPDSLSTASECVTTPSLRPLPPVVHITCRDQHAARNDLSHRLACHLYLCHGEAAKQARWEEVADTTT